MEITANENPDDPNCQPVANTGLTFPGCCFTFLLCTRSKLFSLFSEIWLYNKDQD
jgi:hypothetical protein